VNFDQRPLIRPLLQSGARFVRALAVIFRAKSGAVRPANQGLMPALGIAAHSGPIMYWGNTYGDTPIGMSHRVTTDNALPLAHRSFVKGEE